MKQTAVILINTGSPEKPDLKSVRRYLFQFLNDRRVIDLPYILQKILVNLIIVPFRAAKSTEKYKLLWTESGFPLIYLTKSLSEKLQSDLGVHYKIFFAMAYGKPSMKEFLKKFEFEKFDKIIFFPLFPQYASSTTGSIFELITKAIEKNQTFPEIRFISQFYNEPEFIKAWVSQIKSYALDEFEHIIFSFHGLPIKHINKCHPQTNENECSCESLMPEHGKFCYKATCYETTRLISSALDLERDKYSISFQSRLTENWLKPFTDKLIIENARKGLKKILIIAPSFVSDCLETLIELEQEYGKLFIENGGEQLILVRSLNDSDEWVTALSEMIKRS